MKLYIIYWYPKVKGDCEKRDSYVLCNNQSAAWKIAKAKYNDVIVAEVTEYSKISGGNKGEFYWADYAMINGEIVNYEYIVRNPHLISMD